MTDSNPLKVLLYSDGTEHSISAAVYTANLFYSIPNMHLTILYIKENDEASVEEDDSPMETRSPNLHLVEKADSKKRMQDSEISTKTNEIFTERGHKFNQKVIYSNCNIPDAVEGILGYARNYGFKLIILGTRGITGLRGLIHGSLAHSMLNKSDIPVLISKN